VSTHRNPKHWPHQPSSFHAGNDLDEFKPERWFPSCSEVLHRDSGVELGTDQEEGSPDMFFAPQKGAFILYSIGQRECIGKRFAQIEMLAVLAVVFQDWSVEMVVDGEEALDDDLWKEAWNKTREIARGHLKCGMEHYMTMQLRKGLVPLKIVKRGFKRVL
jgi:cytochrome P450